MPAPRPDRHSGSARQRTADSPAEPDISHIPPYAGKTWLGHPPQLAWLFSIEMWERFGFYGMRTLLILYLTKHFLLGRLALLPFVVALSAWAARGLQQQARPA